MIHLSRAAIHTLPTRLFPRCDDPNFKTTACGYCTADQEVLDWVDLIRATQLPTCPECSVHWDRESERISAIRY